MTCAGWPIIHKADDLEILLVRPYQVDNAELISSIRSALCRYPMGV